MTYTVKFNKVENPRKEKNEDVDGPIVERKCPKCGHDKMSYAAVQLR
jgi:DNA-directed RNA polymerase I subunit RPA12